MAEVRNVASVTDLVRRWTVSRPDQDAIVVVHDAELEQADHLSYFDLDRLARGIAAWLQGRLSAGSRVLLLYPPAAFAVAFIGCLYAGMVAVPAPLPGRYPHERRRLRGIATDAGISAILTDHASRPGVEAWVRAEGLGSIELRTTDAGDPGDPSAWQPPPTDRDTIALLQYTSGSTGEPKGVVVTHGNVLSNVAALCQALDVPDGSRFGGWAPLYHDMGLLAQTLPALLRGSTCVLMSPTTFLRRPVQWLQLIDRYDVAWSAAPNFAYELCRRRVSDEQISGLDLSRWRFAVNGSEPVQASTMAAFAERFAAAGLRADAACPCYGLAESTVFVSGAAHRAPVVSRIDPDLLERGEFSLARPGGGRAIPSNGVAHGAEVRIVDPATGVVLPPGRIGEIWLRGASVARGYWRNEAATEATFRARTADGEDGYLRTGDLGTVHDGEVYVTGRLKETMIIYGRTIYPQDIEHELRAHHLELGNVGAVFTVPARSGGTEQEQLMVTHEVRGRLAADGLRQLAARMKHTVAREFGVPVGGVALLRPGAVRRTTSGKVQRSAMRALLMSGGLDAEYADASTLGERREPQR